MRPTAGTGGERRRRGHTGSGGERGYSTRGVLADGHIEVASSWIKTDDHWDNLSFILNGMQSCTSLQEAYSETWSPTSGLCFGILDALFKKDDGTLLNLSDGT